MNILNQKFRKTDIRAGIVIPTAARHDFSGFIRRLNRSLIGNNYLPSATNGFPVATDDIAGSTKKFTNAKISPILVITPSQNLGQELSARLKASAARGDIRIVDGPQPIGARIAAGMDYIHKSADVVLATCDDFDHLLQHFSRFIPKIGRDATMMVGSWNAMAHTFLPYPLFLNEAGLSIAVAYAHPNHPASIAPTVPGTIKALSKFRKSSGNNFHQVFIGLFGMPSKSWPAIRDSAQAIFRGATDSWENVGFEAGVIIAANHLGIGVGEMELPKRFEHPLFGKNSSNYAEEAERFRRSRIVQFSSGMALVAQYVQNTQPEKLQAIIKFRGEMLHAIADADFYWPKPHENWPIATDWNTQIRTGF